MNKKEIEAYRKAGQIAKQVKDYVRKFVKKDMLLIDIANKIDDKIYELEAKPGFPVNLSLNETAAHYTPSLKDETKAEGLLKIDIGVEIDGFIADTAFSIDLTENNQHKEMIKLNEKVLSEALSLVKAKSIKTKIGEIGTKIHDTLEDYNKKSKENIVVIKNLSGHSLGKNEIHAGLCIHNYKNENATELKNVAIAIEPFLTKGEGEVYEGKEGEIYVMQNVRQVRDKDARELLNFIIDQYDTKPFCKRWLEKESFNKLDFSLRTLVREGVLHNYPVLIERSKQPVSQAEDTVLILDEGVEVITS